MRKNKNRGYQKLDSFAFKLENGLLKLVESLERKRARGEWIDHLMVKEAYQYTEIKESNTPTLQYSNTPYLVYGNK